MNEYDIQKFYIDLGSKIHTIRKQCKINQDQLAEKVGLTRTSIVNIEKGRQKVLIHTLINIASALNADLKELIPVEPPFNYFIVNSEYNELPKSQFNELPKTEQQLVNQLIRKIGENR
jgi:DNA-binding XRE family transcriptional regulator